MSLKAMRAITEHGEYMYWVKGPDWVKGFIYTSNESVLFNVHYLPQVGSTGAYLRFVLQCP